jgi:hypothetical protein
MIMFLADRERISNSRRITSNAFLLLINIGNGFWSGWTAPPMFISFSMHLSLNWTWSWWTAPVIFTSIRRGLSFDWYSFNDRVVLLYRKSKNVIFCTSQLKHKRRGACNTKICLFATRVKKRWSLLVDGR